jgi:hypothetical protein
VRSRLLLAAVLVAVLAGVLIGVLVRSRVGQDPAGSPFFGVEVPDADVGRVDRLADRLGCAPTVLDRFVKLNSDFGPADLRRQGGDGRTPMVSLEPWTWQMRSGQTDEPAYSLAALARGDHDAELRRVADVLATHHGPVLLRFAHEMNADWYPWGVGVNGGTAAGYVRAWRHVHDLMDAEAPNLRWVWSPVAAWWPDPLPYASVYPGDAWVDYVGATGYGHGGTAQQTFGDWHRRVRRFTDRPALLSETGASGPGKVAWTRSLARFLRDHRDVRGFVWFDTSPATTGATGDYRIEDPPEHVQAFRDLLREVGVRGCRS